MTKIYSSNAHRLKWVLSLLVVTAPLIMAPATTTAAVRAVRQGTTSTYGVLAGTTVTNTGATTISGTAGADIGLFPGTSFTGSASVTMSGAKHITDTAATIAQTDLVTAYRDLSIPTPTILSSPNLAGRVLLPGTYATSAGTFANSGKLTLDAQGDPNKVFIFQAASTVITSTGSTMVLANGAQACNVYWRVGSSATIGVSSTFIGHVYALTSIAATTSATIYGQLLARNGAVTLDRNTIVNSACATAAVTTTTTRATGVTTTTARATPTSSTSPASNATTTVSGSGGELPATGGTFRLFLIIGLILLLTGVVRVSFGRRG
ncbi:MAG: DUF3494 domain-containing protein [Actinobacteria bacterium]|nr:DUF3494 domain-containing protein [Actinomycetota bacterium]